MIPGGYGGTKSVFSTPIRKTHTRGGTLARLPINIYLYARSASPTHTKFITTKKKCNDSELHYNAPNKGGI